MGWGRGTQIFDQVVEDLLELTTEYNISGEEIPALMNLYKVLSELDWDNECESDYWNHPVIGKILGNTFEEEDCND